MGEKGIIVEVIFVMRCKVWVQGAALDLGSRSPGTVPGRGYRRGGDVKHVRVAIFGWASGRRTLWRPNR